MGQPVVHWEFWSEDPVKVSDFYAKVFDWDVRHIPEMNYRLVETGGEGGTAGGGANPFVNAMQANLKAKERNSENNIDAAGGQYTDLKKGLKKNATPLSPKKTIMVSSAKPSSANCFKIQPIRTSIPEMLFRYRAHS